MKVYLSFLIAGLALAVRAQPYALNWFSIEGGGGTSTGGVYRLRATIGPPDAGSQSGGPYVLVSGFWSYAEVVQTDGAPRLRIEVGRQDVLVAWPTSSTGFQLQETPSLAALVWTDVRAAPRTVGSENQVSLPWQPGMRFFRLRKP